MYRDEDGNIWASYEDYKAYLEELEQDDNNSLINDLIKEFKDSNNKESGYNNE